MYLKQVPVYWREMNTSMKVLEIEEHNAWHKLISSSSSSSPIAAHQQASDRYSVQLEIPMISKVQAV